MRKFWLVLRQEYRSRVFTWRFLLSIVGIPFASGAVFAVAFAVMMLSIDNSPMGYVDEAGLLSEQSVSSSGSYLVNAQFAAFPSEAEARSALERGKIQAYYVLPATFAQDRQARLVYYNTPSSMLQAQFASRVRRALLKDLPADRAARISSTPLILALSVLPETQNSPQEAPAASPVAIRLLLPYIALLFLMMSLNTSLGHLASAMMEEKNNRTVEILVTSVSPNELLMGKTFALIAVGLTQLILMNGLPGIVLGAALLFGASAVNLLPFGAGVLAGLFILILLTFLLASALMITFSSTAAEQTDVKQFAPMVALAFILPPMFLIGIIAEQPHGVFALALSFFPLTAVVSLLMRTAFSIIPAWQFLVSGLILLLSAVGALWFSGRIFRFSMLRYSKPFTIKEVFQAIRPKGM